ncbi:MAG: hypothetical protein M0R05_03485 [Bacilli bacterium]|nr:hypothetical protein [Bacilli bacterium]MDD4077152.1 hypothetical protein [Bacilli bacterium]
MELKICCDASVKLEKMSNVNWVDCQIGEYNLCGDTLNGNIEIRGEYIKDNVEEVFPFIEIVPFTLVFKDKNYYLDNIAVQDFSHQEIINQGIECNFNILIEYSLKSVLEEEEEEKVEEEDEDYGETLTPAEIMAGELEIAEAIDDDAIKQEINQKYDALLKEVLESRDDNFFEEEKKVTVRSGERTEECKSVLGGIKTNYASYRVFYPNKESDIERICKNERVSIDKVYKDNRNTDFLSKKRIIIK